MGRQTRGGEGVRGGLGTARRGGSAAGGEHDKELGVLPRRGAEGGDRWRPGPRTAGTAAAGVPA